MLGFVLVRSGVAFFLCFQIGPQGRRRPDYPKGFQGEVRPRLNRKDSIKGIQEPCIRRETQAVRLSSQETGRRYFQSPPILPCLCDWIYTSMSICSTGGRVCQNNCRCKGYLALRCSRVESKTETAAQGRHRPTTDDGHAEEWKPAIHGAQKKAA